MVREVVVRRMHSSIGIGLLTLLCALPLSSRPASAQQPPPPIQGVTGTIATDGTIDVRASGPPTRSPKAPRTSSTRSKKILPGGKGTKQNPLDDFAEGSRVILRDVAKVDGESPTTTEGVVVDVNHRKNQITSAWRTRRRKRCGSPRQMQRPTWSCPTRTTPAPKSRTTSNGFPDADSSGRFRDDPADSVDHERRFIVLNVVPALSRDDLLALRRTRRQLLL